MADFLDWNPVTGTWYEHDYDHGTDSVVVTTKQDLQPVLDYCTDLRNSGANDKVGDFAHYAIIPAWLQVELMSRGIRFGRAEDTQKLLRVINEEFPRFKVTNLTHNVREFGT